MLLRQAARLVAGVLQSEDRSSLRLLGCVTEYQRTSPNGRRLLRGSRAPWNIPRRRRPGNIQHLPDRLTIRRRLWRGEYHPPPVESSSGYSPHAPATASSLNDAFVQGHPTTDLARQVADLFTHHVPSPTGHIANADRVVLASGPAQTMATSVKPGITAASTTTPEGMLGAFPNMDSRLLIPTRGWQVNEQFPPTQMQNRVRRIDHVVDRNKFNSIEDAVRSDPNSFSAMEIRHLSQNAASYGYEPVGDSWVRVKGS